MRGYNKNLKNFMEYVFKKYKKDETVRQFKTIYETMQSEKEAKKLQRKELLKNKPLKCDVTISSQTANLCIALVNNELDKNRYMNCYTEVYMETLNTAIDELYGNYNNAVTKLLELMKKNG